jgi:hypothetical protein
MQIEEPVTGVHEAEREPAVTEPVRRSATQTFVLRLWTTREPSLSALDSLCGTVEHLGSGRSGPFAREGDLLTFLREQLREPVAPHRDGGAV